MWCKTGHNLNHKNCICKNKLIGRLIEECTSIINETMIKNKDNIDNDNTVCNVFIGLFSVLLIVGIVCFCVFAYLGCLKVKINILIIEHIKMDIKSLGIKNKTSYDSDNICYINDFDVNSLEIPKKELRIGANIYYTRCALNLDDGTIIPLYFIINLLIGYIEEIEGSSSVRNKNIIRVLDMVWASIEDKINPGIKIKDYDKFRFNSDIDLPLNSITEFRSLLINISCVIEKDNEYYPEIYLDECLYVKGNPCPTTTLFSKKI